MNPIFQHVLYLSLVVATGRSAMDDNYTKVCSGLDNRLEYYLGVKNKSYEMYKAMFENCTVVEKSVEIVYLDGPGDYDMSFLSSIREIKGYLLIHGNTFTRLPLTKLRLIRGLSLYTGKSIYVSNNTELREVQMPSIYEILEGDVHFESNAKLCYINTIEWRDIMSTTLGTVSINTTQQCESCNSTCVFNGTMHCWGAGPDMCQKINRLTCSDNCEHDCFGPSATQCCPLECVGGCTSKKNCWACRNFNDRGACVDRCPPEKIYNRKTMKLEANPDAKYAYGTDCVENCPDHMLADDGYCVTTCQASRMPNEENQCVPCDNGVCPKACNGTGYDGLHVGNLDNFINCTIIDGILLIDSRTFEGDPYFKRPGIRMEQLAVFETVQVITQCLYVQANSPNLTSLSFLKNLKVIHGRRLFRYDVTSLVIHRTNLEDLGLSSLREINNGIILITENQNLTRLGLVSLENVRGVESVEITIFIAFNPRLCYVHNFNFSGLVDPSKVVIGKNAPNRECESRNETCSSKCTSDGCWGPGDDECRNCKDIRFGRRCSDLCDATQGLYKDGKQCRKCHDECRDTCHSGGPDNCNACLHVQDGPNCVASCPNSKYLDGFGMCRECHSNCLKGCTGPFGTLEYGGCKDCDIMIESTKECKPPTYDCGDRHRKMQIMMDVWMDQCAIFKKKTEVCRECDAECKSCEAMGTHEDVCKCLNFKHAKHCVAFCPAGYYGNEQKDCQKCHKECKQCVGPSQSNCTMCENFRIYLDEGELDPNNTDYSDGKRRNIYLSNASESNPVYDAPRKFTCNNSCPEWAPDHYAEQFDNVGFDTKQIQFICRQKLVVSENREMETVGAVVGVVCFLGIVAVVVAVMVRQRARAAENKYRLEAKIQGLDDKEILTPTSAKPDMSNLRLIKESELLRGPAIGSGAFGTVYKGIWRPEGENVRVPVAIKVLIEGSNPGLNKELLDEARVMASVVNPCCIRILAVCQTKQMMLITPLVLHGCLLDYIRKEKDKLNSSCMLRWSTQIARGMHFLEQKGIVHRDLAARNILVQSLSQIKITDFGLAKLLDHDEDRYLSTDGKMPIKWLALESIRHRIFTHKSDVWSYGITLWELFTYGARPYEHIKAHNMADHLELGERLNRPAICTIDVHMIMIKCWMLDVDSRPTFEELETLFATMARDPGRYLVIPGDELMRAADIEPEENLDELWKMVSSSVDETKKFITAEDYLNPWDKEADHNRRSSSVMYKDASSSEYTNDPKPPAEVAAQYLDVIDGDDEDKLPSYLDMQRPGVCLDNTNVPLENLSKTNVSKTLPPNSQSLYISSNNSPSQKTEALNYYNDFAKEEERETNEYSEVYTADTSV